MIYLSDAWTTMAGLTGAHLLAVVGNALLVVRVTIAAKLRSLGDKKTAQHLHNIEQIRSGPSLMICRYFPGRQIADV